MTRNRIRIRFRKEGDLRLIGHRDLLRLFERLFRRAGLKLRMSEGFHPKAKISFPSALALGIEGANEAVEVELADDMSAEAVLERLVPRLPEGFAIVSARALDPGAGKSQPQLLTYELPLPAARRQPARRAVSELLARDAYGIQREGRAEPIDLLADLVELEVAGDRLRFAQRPARAAMARPRDVLGALGLADLENEGCILVRTQVELSP